MLTAIAGPLISGLFGGGEKKVTNEVDYVKMVKNAEAAGFNPLTALRNGGAAGFTSTTSPAPLSAGEAIGNAVSAAGDFLQNFDPYADKRREAEFNLAQAQIANLNANTAAVSGLAKPGTMNVPAYTAGRVERRSGAQAAALSTGPLGSQEPTVEKPTRTNPYPAALGLEVNPWMPDAAAFEEHLGDSEVAMTAVGVGQLAADALWNNYRLYRGAYHKYQGAKKRHLDASSGLEGINIRGERVPKATARNPYPVKPY